MKRCCLIGILMLAPQAPAIALTPLPDFKLDGYVATWYEIASIRGFLQSRCARDTRTEYSIGENGALMLESNCLRADGTPERSEARARPMDPRTAIGAQDHDRPHARHLVVSVWPRIDRRRARPRSALAGRRPPVASLRPHPCRDSPALSDDDLKSAAAALAGAQFDLCAMVLTVQTEGRQQPTRVCDIVRRPALPPAPVPGTLQ